MKNDNHGLTFSNRAKSMLRADLKRAFTTLPIYLFAGICFLIPILFLVMTTMMPSTSIDPSTGEEVVAVTFTNVWQAFGSLPEVLKTSAGSSADMQMDITSICNINMLYFAVAVFACIFIAADFRSGFSKNVFSVRTKKSDYVFSKTTVCFVAAAIMFVSYFCGAMIGGCIAGLSFDTTGFGVSGIIASMLSKVLLTLVFVGISVFAGVFAKKKAWASIMGACAGGMLLYTMVPMITPLKATVLNVVCCLAGGGLFAVGFGAISCLVLNKTDLV